LEFLDGMSSSALGVSRTAIGLLMLRLAVASVFLIHGGARWSLGIVKSFSAYFAALGMPFPEAWPWIVTLVELIGGALLAAGIFVRPLCAWFFLQIAVGIVTIHAKAGWFVVGAGRNGAEYSALILACLAIVFLTHDLAPRVRVRKAAG
jgi:putative oxidoreductase